MLQEHLQRHITKYKNYPKKTGVAATLDILYGMKRIADRKCKRKFLGHFANLGKGPSRFRGAGVPEGAGRPGGIKSRRVSLTLFLDQFTASRNKKNNYIFEAAPFRTVLVCEERTYPL